MKKVILMGVPHHNNLGDNALTIAEEQYIKDNFSEYQYYEISEETLEKCVDKVKKYINEDDIIFLHGGGNLGDEYLYVEEGRRKVIKTFKKNKIVIFPQTMYFSNTPKGKDELEKSKKIYSRHKNLTIVAREAFSYDLMKKEFKDNNVIKTPDIVTYLHKTEKQGERQGLLFILRNDIEANINKEQTQEMHKIGSKYFSVIEYSDTAKGKGIMQSEREEKLEEMLKKYRKAELVITDRLHGMIFAAITSTPCIAIGNYNYKIKGCCETLKHLGYIEYADDISEIEEKICKLMGTNYAPYDNTFSHKEFEKITECIKPKTCIKEA